MVSVQELQRLSREQREALGPTVEVAPGVRVSPGLIDPETGAVKRLRATKARGGRFSAEAISARERAAREASKRSLKNFQVSEAKRIEKEFKQDRSNLNREFRQTLLRTKDPRERKNITTEFFIKGRDLVNQRSLDRVAAGIIKSFTVGGQRITAETVKGFKAPIITSAQQERSLGRLERGEIESFTIDGQKITKSTLPAFRRTRLIPTPEDIRVSETPFAKVTTAKRLVSEVLIPGTKIPLRVLGGIPLKQLTGKLGDIIRKSNIKGDKLLKIIRSGNEKTIGKLPITQVQKDFLLDLSNKQLEVEREIVIGGLEAIEKDPKKIIAIATLSTLAPEVIAGIGLTPRILTLLNRIPPSVKAKGANVVNSILAAAYLTDAGLRVSAKPKKERAREVGRIAVSEVAPFEIGTRLGVKGLLKQNLQNELDDALAKLPKKNRAAFQDYLKQAELFGKFEPRANNIKLDNIESIPDKTAQRIIRKFIKDNNIVIGGTVAQTGQIKVVRKLGDIDAYLEVGTPIKTAQDLANLLKKGGVPRVSSQRGQITIAGKKAIEFNDIERLLTNIRQVTPSWRNPRAYLTRTPEGIVIQRISLQARRKAVAGFADPKRFATGKFQKDIKDFKNIADQLFLNAERKARSAFFFKKKKIREVETIFGKKVTIPVKELKVKLPIKKEIKPVIEKFKLKDATGKFREPEILRRDKIKSKSNTFFGRPSQTLTKPSPLRPSQLPTKFFQRRLPSPLTGRSQPPVKRPPTIRIPPPTLKPPSQPPTKAPILIRVPPILLRPPSRLVPPSQLPVKLPKVPRIPPPFRPPKLPIPKKKSKVKVGIPIKRGSYNVFVRPLKKKGEKTRPKLIKAATRQTKTRARSIGAFLIDKSLARTWKIKKSSKPIGRRKLIKIPDNYFTKTSKKYRTFRIVKGEKIPLKNKWIEKRGKPLLDTREEKQKITLRRKLAQVRKQSKVLLKKRRRKRK